MKQENLDTVDYSNWRCWPEASYVLSREKEANRKRCDNSIVVSLAFPCLWLQSGAYPVRLLVRFRPTTHIYTLPACRTIRLRRNFSDYKEEWGGTIKEGGYCQPGYPLHSC
jgi:hypothetical protein